MNDLSDLCLAQRVLTTLMRGEPTRPGDIKALMELLLRGSLKEKTQFTCGALLTLLMCPPGPRLEALEELSEALACISQPNPRVELAGRIPVAVVGSGKDELKTFNVSTCASLVAVACGATVAKVGCGAETSAAGTMDVLSGLGLDPLPPFVRSMMALKSCGFAVFATEVELPELFSIYIGRTPVFTALEYVLPCYIGIDIDTVVYGLSDPRTELAGHLLRKHKRTGVIVAGTSNCGAAIDELSVLGPSVVTRVMLGEIETFTVMPTDLGFYTIFADEDIAPGATIEEAIQIAARILQGHGNAAQNAMVAANAAAILWAGGITRSLQEGIEIALEAICTGAGWRVLEKARTILAPRREEKP